MRWKWKGYLPYQFMVVIFLLLYGWQESVDESFVNLEMCPACYGQSLCGAMLKKQNSDVDNFLLRGYSQWKIMKFFNIKNVYFASFHEKLVVMKKLAHDSELQEFDEVLCKASRHSLNCNVSLALKTLLSEAGDDILQVISRHPELFEKSDATKCAHNRTILELFKKYSVIDYGPYHRHHFLTMLAVNMEPLMMMTYHSKWFPAIHGTCGRIIVEEYVGPTLTHLAGEPWHIRADYARQLLEMAGELSDGEFRLYLTDVSMDNFAVDEQGRVKIIDAENLVIVDSLQDNLDSSEHVNDGFGCKDCLSFSYEDLCSHRSSDHNFFAVCKGMLSSTSFSEDIPEGLLHSPPDWVMLEHTSIFNLIEECAAHPLDPYNYSKPKRREAAAALHSLLLAVTSSNQLRI
ncbi:hypothetical protein SK128_004051 [Halocaridina rubra]|uniref:FAM69 protein-kinase domain-containing protein n=1 Tax=Halocaridina rubra TaxID=373956 RepID=A0AAN8XFE7_HALRR